MSDDAERFYELHDDIMREARAYEDAAAQPLPRRRTTIPA